MAKKEPLYPHVPKSRKNEETIIPTRQYPTVAETPEDFPGEVDEQTVWQDIGWTPKYPLNYTEYGAEIKGTREELLGHISYYYLPDLKVGCIETASPILPDYKRHRELELTRYAVKDLFNKGAEYIYITDKRLFPLETLWEAQK